MKMKLTILVVMTITTLTYSHVENECKYIQQISKNRELQQKSNSSKQEFLSTLKFTDSTSEKLVKHGYQSKSFQTLFKSFDFLEETSSMLQDKIPTKKWFNLSVRIGGNRSSLKMGNPNFESRENLNFGNQITPRIGLETEFVLPFNKGKWSIIAEPTYQYYKSDLSVDSDNISGGIINSNLKYNSIQLPIGLRHYLFLNKSTKLFINASYHISEIDLDSSVDFKRADGSDFNDPLGFDRERNLALGLGIKTLNRFSLEFRYLGSPRVINALFWNSEYQTASLIFGFTFL